MVKNLELEMLLSRGRGDEDADGSDTYTHLVRAEVQKKEAKVMSEEDERMMTR